VLHLRPEDALTFGAAVQTARLMGGEMGTAFVVTLVRVRAQHASNTIGQHIGVGDGPVTQRLAAMAAAVGRTADATLNLGRGAGLLSSAVRTAAALQGVIDAFVVVGGMTALLRAPEVVRFM
jgi:DHA2 family multidrug resistance protein